jgi:hypothetical protein
LTVLLAENDVSKASFRMLVGVGYQTLQSLLLDFCKWLPSQKLLDAILGMLVDGTFDKNEETTIKNEDVIILFLNVLQKVRLSLGRTPCDVCTYLWLDIHVLVIRNIGDF